MKMQDMNNRNNSNNSNNNSSWVARDGASADKLLMDALSVKL